MNATQTPSSTRLFHITALENMPAIARAGALLAKNQLSAQGQLYTNIAYAGAQGKRARKTVPLGRGGLLHDYVPFYFAPRSPMLAAINGGNVPDFANGQVGVVTLETTVSKAIAHDPAGFVIYDMNATLDYSTAYATLNDLDKVAWDLLFETPRADGFCTYWNSKQSPEKYSQRKEKRMAEFLVHQQVPFAAVSCIGVANDVAQQKLRLLLTGSPLQALIAVRSDWYY
jgi:hypothetical protein